MKVGVLADSHDNVPMVEAAVRRFVEKGVELVIHAGDFVAPFAVAPLEALPCPVVAVFGNNDGERVGLANRFAAGIGEVHPILAETEVGGCRIAAVHYPELADAIAPGGVYDLVIYGHTHEVEIRPGRSLVLNPGEAGGWLTGRATVAVVDLPSLDVEMLELRT